jgi:hypothetical protein
MSEDEWVDVAALPLIADERWLHAVSNGVAPKEDETPSLHIVPLADFVAVEEETAEPLLGTGDATILPRSGRLLMYGDGGAGKTTLSLDAAAHIASGTNWIGLHVEQPYRILIIENEGPRGKFRQRLGEKIRSWQGEPFSDNVFVLEEPWTRFTFETEAHREHLAIFCATLEIDIVMVGPLATIGMVGGGTPDEINTFTSLLDDLNDRSPRSFALWIIHHENKSGDVSGAWERAPDTLLHIQAQGNGHTRLHWQKARWSDEHHKTSVDLLWSEGRSFSVVEEKQRDPWVEMLVAFTHANSWRTVKESARLISISEGDAKKVLAELVRRGEMEYEQGPPGRHGSAHCYRLKGALADSAHLSAPTPVPPSGGALEYSPLPLREGGTQRRSAGAAPKAALDVSAPSAPDDDGIPF